MPTILLVATAMTGCTQKSPPLPDATTQPRTKLPDYPIKVFRGCNRPCGFNDELNIQSDGGVLVQVKGRMLQCQLDRASFATLNDAAVTIEPTDLPTRTARDDELQVALVSGAGVVDINDERIAKAKPVIEQLLDDVHAPAAQRKICT
ncbi:MAG TPA: hypothetical protein VFM86_14625 [Pedococcus sp.]|nr:hypothetical protein [Pedococcus sp.]